MYYFENALWLVVRPSGTKFVLRINACTH
ncbi:MAG: hypothetical protein IJ272_03585 [Clostridia bacterium]|nr:hypothetical protein [Clostridia bacterium]